jgi:hypothetical protein
MARRHIRRDVSGKGWKHTQKLKKGSDGHILNPNANANANAGSSTPEEVVPVVVQEEVVPVVVQEEVVPVVVQEDEELFSIVEEPVVQPAKPKATKKKSYSKKKAPKAPKKKKDD